MAGFPVPVLVSQLTYSSVLCDREIWQAGM